MGIPLGGRLMPSMDEEADATMSAVYSAVPGAIGAQDISGPYEIVDGWPQNISELPDHEGWTWGAAGAFSLKARTGYTCSVSGSSRTSSVRGGHGIQKWDRTYSSRSTDSHGETPIALPPGRRRVDASDGGCRGIALGGGVTSGGAEKVRIIRVVNGERNKLKVSIYDEVLPGDTIIVPRRFFF
jgi:hypothetical protein